MAAEPILQFFAYNQSPPLRAIARPFALLAEVLVHELPKNPERADALRKLLEARDAALRAFLYLAPESMAARPGAPNPGSAPGAPSSVRNAGPAPGESGGPTGLAPEAPPG